MPQCDGWGPAWRRAHDGLIVVAAVLAGIAVSALFDSSGNRTLGTGVEAVWPAGE